MKFFFRPWRWLDDTTLDCCEPLEKIQGITFGKVACLAVCYDWFMVISRLQKATSFLYTMSAPPSLRDFIKWVAEVRRQEDGSTILSEEEKGRLALKEEVSKQIRETELFKHVTRYLAFESSLCDNVASLGYRDKLADIAANVCCQGAELLTEKIRSSNGLCCKVTNMKLLKADGKDPVAMVSGTVNTDATEQRIDVLIPSSQIEPSSLCDFDQNICGGMHPSIGDGLTLLLFALPKNTWLSLGEEKLQAEMKGLATIEALPTLLQEEVMHLQQQLHFLKADLNISSS
ncbi:hypothetical protein DITRI_Ditri11bG0074900 [Diplodiscus trichospermus]